MAVYTYTPGTDPTLKNLYSIASQYASGGGIYEKVSGIQSKTAELAEKTYQKGKKQSMSKIAQSLVSAGLSKTPTMAGAELAYEQEIGGPLRESLALETQKMGIGLEEKRLDILTQVVQRMAAQEQEATRLTAETGGLYGLGGAPSAQSRNLQGTEGQTGAQIAASMGSYGGYPVGPSTAGQTSKNIVEAVSGGDGGKVEGYGPEGPGTYWGEGYAGGNGKQTPAYLTDYYGKPITGETAAFAEFLVKEGYMPANTNMASWVPGHTSEYVRAQKKFKAQR